MKNIREIALLAGVSRATVSRVLNNSPSVNEETRIRVREVIEKHHYRPNLNARQITSERAPVIGVVVPSFQDPFFSELVSGVEQVCVEQGNVGLLVNEGGFTAESERMAISHFMNRGCDGLIVHAKYLPDDELVRFVKRQPNTVLISRAVDSPIVQSLSLDNVVGGALAAELLIRHGRRSIALVTTFSTTADCESRLQGVRSAMAEAGMDLEDHQVYRELSTVEGGRVAMRRILSAGVECNGVIAFNDTMAIGAMQTIVENGLSVPDDISIVGFDNLSIGAFSVPRLTTVDYPIELMARRATSELIEMIKRRRKDDPSTASVECLGVVCPTLIERESTAKS